jgi:hypothetical protein
VDQTRGSKEALRDEHSDHFAPAENKKLAISYALSVAEGVAGYEVPVHADIPHHKPTAPKGWTH